jgi:hypothetical protein
MRTLIGLVFTIVAKGALAQSVELHVMQGGAQQAVNDEHVAEQLAAFVESATVDSTGYARPAERWHEALASPIFIHALFNPLREMEIWKRGDENSRGRAQVQEIVVVFSGDNGAGHILVKTPQGFRSITKYSPCAHERLITAAKLDSVLRVNYLREYCQRHPTARLDDRWRD